MRDQLAWAGRGEEGEQPQAPASTVTRPRVPAGGGLTTDGHVLPLRMFHVLHQLLRQVLQLLHLLQSQRSWAPRGAHLKPQQFLQTQGSPPPRAAPGQLLRLLLRWTNSPPISQMLRCDPEGSSLSLPNPGTTQIRGRGDPSTRFAQTPPGSHRQAKTTKRTEATHTAAQVTEAPNTPGHAATPQSMLGHGPPRTRSARDGVRTRAHTPTRPACR